MHTHERAHTGVAALQLLCDQSILDIRHAGTAVALEVRSEKTKLAHGPHQLPRKTALAIALLDDRYQVLFNEFAGIVAHQPFIRTEERIELNKIDSVKFEDRHI